MRIRALKDAGDAGAFEWGWCAVGLGLTRALSIKCMHVLVSKSESE